MYRYVRRFSAGLSLSKKSPGGGGVSLKDRFASWWNGTELREAVHGLIFPGGAEYVEELVSGYSLSSDETILDGRIGMGGNATTIVAKFGNYVTVVAKMYDSLKEGEAYFVITGFLLDEDAESERYSEMIRGWAGYLNEIIGKSVNEAFGRQLVHEAQYWLLLTSALDSGDLKYYRVEGVKRS